MKKGWVFNFQNLFVFLKLNFHLIGLPKVGHPYDKLVLYSQISHGFNFKKMYPNTVIVIYTNICSHYYLGNHYGSFREFNMKLWILNTMKLRNQIVIFKVSQIFKWKRKSLWEKMFYDKDGKCHFYCLKKPFLPIVVLTI